MLRLTRRLIRTNRSTSFVLEAPADTPVFPEEKFRDLYFTQIVKFKLAFEALRKFEPRVAHVAITPFKEALQVHIEGLGQYSFDPNYPLSLLYLMSPVSGAHSYFFDENEASFLNSLDRHNIEELVAREVLHETQVCLDP